MIRCFCNFDELNTKDMKKSFLFSLTCIVCLTVAQLDSFAQYEKGDIILNPGLGLGYWYGGGSGFAVGFCINAEFSITDDIAVGPYFAYTHKNYNYGSVINGDYNYNFIDIGARGSYHFARLLNVNNDKFDPYAGAFIGFVSSSGNADPIYNGYYTSYGSRVQAGVFAGARYYFSDKFAAFGEVGAGLHPVFIGVTFKLK
jgi:hypothetical protein